MRDRLVSLKVTDSVDADSDACELVLDDRGGAVVEPPPTGAVLEVDLGWCSGGVSPMGRFVVDEEADRAREALSGRPSACGCGPHGSRPRCAAGAAGA